MTDKPSTTRIASIAVFASASLWGLYWLPLRYLEQHGVAGGWAVALLNLPAAPVLLPVIAYYWQRHGYQRWLRAAGIIGLFTGLGLAFYGIGLVHTSVVRATMLFYLTPVWATIIGIAWLGEHAGLSRWLAIGAGLIGLALLLSGGGSTPVNIGDLFALLSGVFWAVGAAAIMRYADVPLPLMTAIQFFVTSVAAVLLGSSFGGDQLPAAADLLAMLPLGSLIAIGLFLPGIGLIFWAQKILFPGRVGLLMMSEALVAVISASLLLPEETLSLLQWSGAALIITACLLEVLLSPEQTTGATQR